MKAAVALRPSSAFPGGDDVAALGEGLAAIIHETQTSVAERLSGWEECTT